MSGLPNLVQKAIDDYDACLAGKPGEVRAQGTAVAEWHAERRYSTALKILMAYHTMALNQTRWIFWVGVACIVFGFKLVLLTLLAVSLIRNPDHQVVTAVLGGVGTIVVNFIAAIYLRMYGEIMKALTSFHETLSRRQYVHIGGLLAAGITNSVLKESTLSEMAKELASANK